MLNKTRAIVLHQLKYGESSLIVTFYTEKYGRIACLVNGIRSKKGKFPATLFQPLTLLEADFYYRQNRELQRLKDAYCPFHYSSIPFNISKSTIALFLSEVLYLALREEETNPLLFSYLFHAFQLLDTKDEGSANFHLWFMLHLTKYLGISIPQQYVEGEDTLSSDMKVFHAISAEASAALKLLALSMQGPPDKMQLSYRDRTLLLERIINFYTIHLDGFSRLKSFAVLQEVFR
jgi:DNA repair protein RecO (recombination protein O)